jgi:hypothetical protein
MDIRQFVLDRLASNGRLWWELTDWSSHYSQEWERTESRALLVLTKKAIIENLPHPRSRLVPGWSWWGNHPRKGAHYRFFEQRRSISLKELHKIIRSVGLTLEPSAPSIPAAVRDQMRRSGMTPYRLSKLLQGKVPKRTLFRFLSSDAESADDERSINVTALGHIFDALSIRLVVRTDD